MTKNMQKPPVYINIKFYFIENELKYVKGIITNLILLSFYFKTSRWFTFNQPLTSFIAILLQTLSLTSIRTLDFNLLVT